MKKLKNLQCLFVALLMATTTFAVAFSGTEEVYVGSAGGTVPLVHPLINSPSTQAYFCGRLTAPNDASSSSQSAGGGLVLPVCAAADATNFGQIQAARGLIQVVQGGLTSPGAGSYENLYIPPSVARQAAAQARAGGTPYFYFVREFQTGIGPLYRIIRVRLTGNSALVPLTLNDVRLAFSPDSNPQTIGFVKRGQTAPSWAATVHYSGTGVLKGRWELVEPGDPEPQARELLTEASIPVTERGLARRYRELGRFNMTLPAGSTVRIPGPDPQKLPTDLEGRYQILLRIEADYSNDPFLGDARVKSGAIAAFAIPSLAYYVGAAESRQANLVPVTPAKIELQYPVVGQTYLPQEVLTFHWKKATTDRTPRVYRIEFKSSDRPELRSFLTSGDRDHLVVAAWLKERIAGRNVSWRVVSLDAQGIQTAASEWRSINVN
jgi:hypothetical protein